MKPIRIAIVGPECSGKTTLAGQISSLLDAPLVPEFSRMYFKDRKYEYDEDDILRIALGQQKLEMHYASFSHAVLVCDTNNLVNWIWSEYKYGRINESLKAAYNPNEYGLHLLCKPDLIWESDPLRENAGNLEDIYMNYLRILNAMHVPYVRIEGEFAKRYQLAISALQELEFYRP